LSLSFSIEKHGDNDFKLKIVTEGKEYYLTFFQQSQKLGFYPTNGGDYLDQHWELYNPSDRCGFLLCNKAQAAGSNHLYYKDSKFGVYSGEYSDQRWIAVL
jgi:hypothetical protein